MAKAKQTAPKARRAGGMKVSETRSAVRRKPGPKVTWVKVDLIGGKGHGVEFTHVALPDKILAFVDGQFVFSSKPCMAATVEILSRLPATLPKATGAQLKRAILLTLERERTCWQGRGDIRAWVNG